MANMQDNGTNWLFGQYGSALLDLHENDSGQALYLFPPKGMVVVAITALYDTTFKASKGLVSERSYGRGGRVQTALGGAIDSYGNYPYITTENGASNGESAHEIGDFQVTGCKGTGSSSDQLTLGGSTHSHNIRVGQIIESIENGAPDPTADIPRVLENPVRVKAYDGAATVTMNRPLTIGAAANRTVAFYNDLGQGWGGQEMDANNTIPSGVTIYGRWTQIGINYSTDGMGIICYFGPSKVNSYDQNPMI